MLVLKTTKSFKTLLFTFSALFFLSGCYYDNEEELYPNNQVACGTEPVTFSNDVSNIIQSNCMQCHSAAVNSGNINLEGYTNIKTYADNGKLIGVITHAPGHSPMPKNGNKLSDCDISLIQKWIDSGSLNN